MEIFTLFTTTTFFILWNLLAVIGVVFLILKISQSIPAKKSPSLQENINSKAISNKKNITSETSQPLLKIGLLLIWISLISIGFSKGLLSIKFTSLFLVCGIFLIHILLSYLLSLSSKTKSSLNFFLKLTLISIIFYGIKYWTKNLSIYSALSSFDYFAILSILISAISFIYFKYLKNNFYFFTFSLSLILFIYFVSNSILPNKLFVNSLILLLNFFYYLATRVFFKNNKQFRKYLLPLLRINNVVFEIAHMIMLSKFLYSIETPLEVGINLFTLFIPFIFTIVVLLLNKRGITLLVEGVLFPFRFILISSLLLIGGTSYHFWVISLFLFAVGAIITFTSLYRNPSIRRFIFPMMLSSSLLSLILMFSQPFYRDSFDTLPIGVTLLIFNLFFILKINKYKFYFLRFFDSFIQIPAICAILYSLETNLRVSSFSPEIISLTLLIPAGINFVELLSTEESKKKVYTVLNLMIFLSASSIISITTPEVNIFVTLLSSTIILMVTFYLQPSLFGISILSLLMLCITSFVLLIKGGSIEILILNTILLVKFGNLWRFVGIFKKSARYAILERFVHVLRRTSIVASIPLLLYSFFTINYNSSLIILFYLALVILYLTAPGKKSRLRFISLVGLILIFWNFINLSDTPKYAKAQLFAFPVVLVTFWGSCKLELTNKFLSKFARFIAISLPMNIAIINSIFDPHPFNIYQGVLLLVISTILIVFGYVKKDKLLIILPIVYLFIELFVFGWRYFSIIPWWSYLAVLGLIFVVLSIKVTLGISDSKVKIT